MMTPTYDPSEEHGSEPTLAGQVTKRVMRSIEDKNNNSFNSWPEPPPERTKWVDQKGGFTNIDAYWIIQVLTERFGPIGMGWNLDVEGEYSQNMLLYTLSGKFKYDVGGSWFSFPVAVAVKVRYKDSGGKERLDDDAPKKAHTAFISKAASYLGIGRSVYAGEWDRARSNQTEAPQQRQQQQAPPQQQQAPPQPVPQQGQLGSPGNEFVCIKCGGYNTVVKPTKAGEMAVWCREGNCRSEYGGYQYKVNEADEHNKPGTAGPPQAQPQQSQDDIPF